MAIGFRKGLFGFNCDDVMEYIESTHKAFSEKEIVFGERIDELEAALSESKKQLDAVMSAKAAVERELKEYTDKYEEIERLSQNIGKLYLVAQANAQAAIKTSEESINTSKLEVEKNLASIDEAHRSLEELREKIVKTSADFEAQVVSLSDSLDDTRAILEQNDKTSAEKHTTGRMALSEFV